MLTISFKHNVNIKKFIIKNLLRIYTLQMQDLSFSFSSLFYFN